MTRTQASADRATIVRAVVVIASVLPVRREEVEPIQVTVVRVLEVTRLCQGPVRVHRLVLRDQAAATVAARVRRAVVAHTAAVIRPVAARVQVAAMVEAFVQVVAAAAAVLGQVVVVDNKKPL